MLCKPRGEATTEQQMSDVELGTMKVIWANDGPAPSASIMEELVVKDKTWQKSMVIMLLSRLMGKGYLKTREIGCRNEYTILVSESKYQTTQMKDLLSKVYEGNAGGLVSTLIQSDLLTDEEYRELKAMPEGGNRADE